MDEKLEIRRPLPLIPEDTLGLDYLIAKIKKDELAIRTRYSQVKDLLLDREKLLNLEEFKKHPSQYFKIMEALEISLEYEKVKLYYALEFNHSALDTCRKIVELLVRLEQNMNYDVELRNVRDRINQEVRWPKEQKIDAIEIYSVASLSIHNHRYKLIEKSAKHSKINDAELSRELDISKAPSERVAAMLAGWKKMIHGSSGFDSHTLDIINKTRTLVDWVLKFNELPYK